MAEPLVAMAAAEVGKAAVSHAMRGMFSRRDPNEGALAVRTPQVQNVPSNAVAAPRSEPIIEEVQDDVDTIAPQVRSDYLQVAPYREPVASQAIQPIAAAESQVAAAQAQAQKAPAMVTNQLTVLREIAELQKTQQQGPLPSMPDPPKMISTEEEIYLFQRTGYWKTMYNNTMDSMYFALDLVPGYSDFVNMFDLWTIVQVTVKFFPVESLSHAGYSSPLCTAIDYTDSSVPGNMDVLRKYGSYRIHPTLGYAERTIAPKLAHMAYKSILSSGYSPNSGWCSTSCPGIQWYGLKFGVAGSQGNERMYYIDVDYIMAFKGSK